MKMILNEYRLMPWQKEAQALVAKHMEDFFFGEGAALPPGYVACQAQAQAVVTRRPAVCRSSRYLGHGKLLRRSRTSAARAPPHRRLRGRPASRRARR